MYTQQQNSPGGLTNRILYVPHFSRLLPIALLLPAGLGAAEPFAQMLDDAHEAIQRGRFAVAGELLAQADPLTVDWPPQDPRRAELFEAYGVLYRSSGEAAQAVSAFEKAIDLWRAASPSQPRRVAFCANNLGVLHDALGQFRRAEQYLSEALELWESSVGAAHPDRLVTLRNLATTYRAQGNYQAAEREYRRLLEARQRGPRNVLALNQARKDVADVLRATGQWAAAAPFYQAIAESAGTSPGAAAAQAWLDLADTYRELDRAADAERLYRQSIAAFSALGSSHEESLAMANNNLGVLLQKQNRQAEAEAAYQSALSLWNHSLPQDHPFVLRAWNNLGAAHLAQEHYAEAEKVYAQLLDLIRSGPGADQSVVAGLSANLATIRARKPQRR